LLSKATPSSPVSPSRRGHRVWPPAPHLAGRPSASTPAPVAPR
jgi:hypothetical protein